MAEHWGESLKALRISEGLTQAELAGAVNVLIANHPEMGGGGRMCQTRISNLERGACMPGLRDLDRLRRVLPMDLTEAVESAIATLNGAGS